MPLLREAHVRNDSRNVFVELATREALDAAEEEKVLLHRQRGKQDVVLGADIDKYIFL